MISQLKPVQYIINPRMQGSKEKRVFIHYFPIYGCVSTGVIYVAIGVFALLSLLKLKDGGADESSLFVFLNDYLAGKILIWVILAGTLSYITWRIYETIKDPYNYGKDWKGTAQRTGIALSTIADALIAFAAIEVLLGISNIKADGEPEEQRQMVGDLLNENLGEWLVIAIGAIILITAVVQFYYGITRGYKERLDIAHFSKKMKHLVHFMAWAGYFARGIILGIIGFFFIKAGISEDAQFIVNTDKAFNFLGENVGHLAFVLVAAGTIFYGLFMFALGATYDVDNDE